MSRAVLSLGGNLGDPRAQLAAAVRTLAPVLTAVSSVYRTPPWGPVAQDDFLNLAVIVSDGSVDATGWLERCHELERAARRERTVRWGPRTLDADVVAVWQPRSGDHGGDVAGAAGTEGVAGTAGAVGANASSDGRASDLRWHDADLGADTDPVLSVDPVLTLPHPRAHERGFVLVPWNEIQPAAVLPGHGPVATLMAGLDVSDIVRIGDVGELPDGIDDRGGQQM